MESNYLRRSSYEHSSRDENRGGALRSLTFYFRILPAVLALTLGFHLQLSCGGGSPLAPELSPDNQAALMGAYNPHRLVSYGLIVHDATTDSFSIMPSRGASGHLNALALLEQILCDDCLTITSFDKLPGAEYIIEVTLIHPGIEGNLKVTAFDVRGIFMFEPSAAFAGLGLTWSHPIHDGANLLNPHGYTTLFSPLMFPPDDPLQGYFQGEHATADPPDAMLNPYIAFTPTSNRRHIIPGEESKITLHISFPAGTSEFGYAIDASWEPPEIDPPTTIPDDFSITANMPEPFALLVDPVVNTLYYQTSVICGGELKLDVRVYDWQGPEPSTFGGTLNAIHMDSPNLLTELNVEPDSWELGYDPLPYVLYRFNLAPSPVWPGTYPLLVAAEDIQPGVLEGTKATAYQVSWIDVAGAPVNLSPFADASATTPMSGPAPLTVHLDPSLSYDPDGSIVLYEWDIDDDGEFEVTSPTPEQVGWIYDTPGEYKVFLRVTDSLGADAIGHILIKVGMPLNEPPVADLSLTGPTSGAAPLEVSLDGSLSYDTDGTVVLWEWDVDGDDDYEFSMGAPSVLVYTYQDPGNWTLKLRVWDDDGAMDTDEVIIQVE